MRQRNMINKIKKDLEKILQIQSSSCIFRYFLKSILSEYLKIYIFKTILSFIFKIPFKSICALPMMPAGALLHFALIGKQSLYLASNFVCISKTESGWKVNFRKHREYSSLSI